MKNTRRMKRMARNHKRRLPALNLTSLMDVFTILVFFLLVNSAASEVLEAPKKITLPDSVVETKPTETAVVMVSDEAVMVQGEAVISIADVIAAKQENIVEISEKLKEIKSNVIGVSTKTVAESSKVTILSHKTIPYKVLQKVMTSCTAAGYGTINLAVIQKASQS
jgi:biopolymer transport protein ExbD